MIWSVPYMNLGNSPFFLEITGPIQIDSMFEFSQWYNLLAKMPSCEKLFFQLFFNLSDLYFVVKSNRQIKNYSKPGKNF